MRGIRLHDPDLSEKLPNELDTVCLVIRQSLVRPLTRDQDPATGQAEGVPTMRLAIAATGDYLLRRVNMARSH